MNNENYDLITIDVLCSMLSIGRNAAYRLLNANVLNSFRIGRVWKIPRIAVEKYILEQSNIKKHSREFPHGYKFSLS